MKSEMILRAEAFEATRKHFVNRPYKLGTVDCLKLARFQALRMGHKPPRPPRYSSEVGAIRALKNMGFNSIDELLSSLFPRIPLAQARVGDLVTGDGADSLDATFIWSGRKLMGFHEDAHGLVMILPERTKSAYRL